MGQEVLALVFTAVAGYLLGSIKVSEGDYVTQGQTVATTQGHVVCDMRLGGAALDPWSVWRNVNPGVLFQ